MPKPVYRNSEAQHSEDIFDRFADRCEWQRSNKGNLWRHWDGLSLTIFKRRDGFFGWCLADDDGPRYSTRVFESETDAILNLASEVLEY